jgi:hypothetical protein
MAITRIDHLQVNRLDVQQTTVAGGNTFVDLANAATDEKAKVSSNDTTPGFLNGKLVAGTNVTLTENNNGGNETLTINANFTDADDKSKVSANDTTAGFLNGKLVAGTNITLTENNNGGNETLTISAAGGGGGLVGFTGSQNSTGVNITVNASRLLADATSVNADIVLQPKGQGAVLAQLPDGTTTGGNKRNSYSVDLQTVRDNAAQVASGQYSVITGGQSSTASGQHSFIGSGQSNTTSGSHAVVGGGFTNSATDTYTFIGGGYANSVTSNAAIVVGGETNSASGQYSTIIGGRNNVASNSYAIAGGRSSTAQSYASIALGESVYVNGSNSVGIGKNVYIDTSNSYGIGNNINASGAVEGVFIGTAITSNTNIGACHVGSPYSNVGSGNYNTIVGGYNHTMSLTNPSYATIIGGENNVANGSYSIAMGEGALAPVNGSRAYASGYFSTQGDAQLVELLVRKNTNDGTAQELCAGTSASNANTLIVAIDTAVSFDILVTARNAATNGESAGWTIRGVIANDGGTVAFVGTPVVTSIGANAGASTWLIAVNADNTNKRLAVNATGQVGKAIGWVAHIRSTQLNR